MSKQLNSSDESKTTKPKLSRHEQLGLTRAQLNKALHGMLLSRAVDDRLWLLSRQGKVHFVITSAGHEAAQFGCALAIRVGHDYVVPYYRDMALTIALGQTPLDLMLHAMGKMGDPSSGGRQMFGHFSDKKLRIVSGSSSVGSHPVHAVGITLAQRVLRETNIAAITFFGEGATAEGTWHEAMNFAGIHRLPVVFVCENNQYAISMHQSKEVPVPDIATKAAGYGMPGIIVDGNNIFDVYEAASTARHKACDGQGPTLIECKTYRFRPHSNADDDSKYRSAEEVDEWRERDPINHLQTYLLEQQLITVSELHDMKSAVEDEVNQATEAALQAPSPPIDSIFHHLYG